MQILYTSRLMEAGLDYGLLYDTDDMEFSVSKLSAAWYSGCSLDGRVLFWKINMLLRSTRFSRFYRERTEDRREN